MFTHHGTHIIGLTAASKHVAMALQPATIISFETAERNWWLLCCWGPPVEHHGRPVFSPHKLNNGTNCPTFSPPHTPPPHPQL